MLLHLPGLPHTVTTDEWSHCAFTNKIRLMAPMMERQGIFTIHYGVEGAKSGAIEQVTIMSRLEQTALLGYDAACVPEGRTVGDVANVSNQLYRTFNQRFAAEVARRASPGDIVLLPFGNGHGEAAELLRQSTPGLIFVEPGIGYEQLAPNAYRIYESHAFKMWHNGRRKVLGNDYEFVVPNYVDPEKWPLSRQDGKYVVTMARVSDSKGIAAAMAIAIARPDLHFVWMGQGNRGALALKTPPNFELRAPVHGDDRGKFYENALCALYPSRFSEPFCQAHVEALTCGVPVLSSDHGVFTETIANGVNGYRCHTMGDYLFGIRQAEAGVFDHAEIRQLAIGRFSMDVVGKQYAEIFDLIAGDAQGSGGPTDVTARDWFRRDSFLK